MKKFIALICCVLLLLSLSGCNKSGEDANLVNEENFDSPVASDVVESSGGSLYSLSDYGADFKTVSNPRFEFSLKIPNSWTTVDTSSNGDGFIMNFSGNKNDLRAYGSYDVSLFGLDGYLDFCSSMYKDISEFVFADGNSGYIMEDDYVIEFVAHDYYSTLNFYIDYSEDPAWYESNKDLIFKIGASLMFSNSDYSSSESSESVYMNFVNSKEWAKDDPYLSGNYYDTDLEVTNYKIFDLDNNGVSELWIETYEYAQRGSYGISGFYTLEAGEVVLLLSGNMSGGSMGGDWIATRYDTQSSKHVVGKVGHVGGFGGTYEYEEYYNYSNGKISLICDFAYEEYGSGGDNVETEYFVDGFSTTKDKYEKTAGRFTEVTDLRYSLDR
jgi:hypothetical protein